MRIGDEVLIHGYIDEIRKDIVIIRNEGGYFGTVENEILNKKHPRWIPVSERMPEAHKEVLTCSFGGFIEIQSFKDSYGGYWENQKGDWSEIDEVVAWMPLPQSYTESEG